MKFFQKSNFCYLSKGNNNGIMRSLGAQLYSTVMYFGSFYLAGVPFGLALMFLTPLKSKGAKI